MNTDIVILLQDKWVAGAGKNHRESMSNAFVCLHTIRMAISKTAKLTLVVDPDVVRRAKSYASAHETSVSSLVEAYLSQLTADDTDESAGTQASLPPITKSLFGALRSCESGPIDERELKVRRLTDKYLHD